MTALPTARKTLVRAAFISALFVAFLVVLRGAQPLAVKGPPLDPNSFATAKKAHYRVVVRGPIEQPLTLSFRDERGEPASVAVTLKRAETNSEAQWKILKARRKISAAHLVIESDSPAQKIELREIDQRAPVRKWIASCLFLAALSWFLIAHRRRRWAQAFALATAYFLFLLPWELPAFYAFSSDSRYYIPTSLSLLHQGNFDLDEFGGSNPAAAFAHDYRVRKGNDGRYFNLYPSGTAIICLPIAWMGDWLYDQFSDSMERAGFIAELAAKLLSAASVALLFLIIAELTNRRTVAFVLALVFALATPQLGTHAGGLWSHTASVFCSLIALGLWLWKQGRFAFLAAIPFAFGFACRPTMAIPGIIFGLALLIRDRKSFIWFAALSGLAAVLFIYHSLGIWGSVVPPYFSGHASGESAGFVAYLGTLLTPNRGLFVYCPVLLFAVAGGVIAFRRRGPGQIYLLAALVCIAEWIAASRNVLWWGGHCYGPRVLCEMLPFAILLLIPAWEKIEQRASRRFFLLLGLLACGWGLFVQVQALANPAVHEWNAAPNIDSHPERLWDWRDWQILAGH